MWYFEALVVYNFILEEQDVEIECTRAFVDDPHPAEPILYGLKAVEKTDGVQVC